MNIFDGLLIFTVLKITFGQELMNCYDEPGVMKMHGCCDIPFTNRIYEKCKTELIKRSQNDTEMEAEIAREELIFGMCSAECEFETKNYLRDTDDIDFKIVKSDLEENFSHDVDYIQTYIKSLRYCLEYARSEAKRYSAYQPLICNFFPGFLKKCALQAAVYNCSPKRWHNSDSCSEIKIWLEKCSPIKKIE